MNSNLQQKARELSISRHATEVAEGEFLRAAGWRYTCDNPAAIWLWQKTLEDGRIVLVPQKTALYMEGAT